MTSRNRNAADWTAMHDDEIDRVIRFEEGQSRRAAITASARLRDSVRHAAGLHPFHRPVARVPRLCLVVLADHERGTWMGVVQTVAAFYGVPEAMLTAPTGPGIRKARYVKARSLVAIMLRNRGFSYPRIGAWLGGRHHATVIHLVDKYEPHLCADERVLVAGLSVAVPVEAEGLA